MIDQLELCEVGRKLESVEWDFAGAKTNTGPHRVHPYPARFIPQLPRTLIELFHPGDDSAVLDPFCGCGTTLVEASLHGIPAVGIDLHPLAVLISRVKTTPLVSPLLPIAYEVCDRAESRVSRGDFRIPAIPKLDHWFQKPIQQALASLVAEIEGVRARELSDALKVALSSIIVRVSNQDSDTRYAAVEKTIELKDVWNQFRRASLLVSKSLAVFDRRLIQSAPQVELINRDLLLVEPADITREIGLVVTSPPYPNAYEYWLYHKYRMYWLGMDPIAVRKSEIGARPHYFKKNHQTELDFERQMEQCFRLLSQILRKGCHACFVVGRSVIHGRVIDNEALLGRAAAGHGFRRVGAIKRRIAMNRKSFNLSHAAIDREGIVIFVLDK